MIKKHKTIMEQYREVTAKRLDKVRDKILNDFINRLKECEAYVLDNYTKDVSKQAADNKFLEITTEAIFYDHLLENLEHVRNAIGDKFAAGEITRG